MKIIAKQTADGFKAICLMGQTCEELLRLP